MAEFEIPKERNLPVPKDTAGAQRSASSEESDDPMQTSSAPTGQVTDGLRTQEPPIGEQTTTTVGWPEHWPSREKLHSFGPEFESDLADALVEFMERVRVIGMTTPSHELQAQARAAQEAEDAQQPEHEAEGADELEQAFVALRVAFERYLAAYEHYSDQLKSHGQRE
jgi:hypothetical protein